MKLPAILRGGHNVVLDTMVFIYCFEDDPQYAGLCEQLILQAAAGLFTGIVTPVTAAEVLVKPLRVGRLDLADRYRDALRSLQNIRMTGISPETGFMAGALRAKYGLPLPDMIQVAVALESQSTALVTNDKALQRIKEVSIVPLDSLLSLPTPRVRQPGQTPR